ncbi:protein gp37 [Paraburkholderia sp. HC6.4b]|nr:protein gp37 [Paraburkholderia sp. HC6.4b]MBB5456093.1 protein gp37 [Paraburkholderia sp. Kb1A]
MIVDALLQRKGLKAHAPWPWPNVWIGATVVNQEEADRDIPKLLEVPARVRFLSAEPLLGPVDLRRWHLSDRCGGRYPSPTLPDEHRTTRLDMLDWVIAGGESGPGARPMNTDWARTLRDQCGEAVVPFLFKQHGEWADASVAAFGSSPGEVRFMRADGTLWAAPPSDEDADCITIRRVGKKAAGRELDGRTHDAFPEKR